MMMLERNNMDIAAVMFKWLGQDVAERRKKSQ
jgi:hypothetical protein